jgi:hypothetical protein
MTRRILIFLAKSGSIHPTAKFVGIHYIAAVLGNTCCAAKQVIDDA